MCTQNLMAQPKTIRLPSKELEFYGASMYYIEAKKKLGNHYVIELFTITNDFNTFFLQFTSIISFIHEQLNNLNNLGISKKLVSKLKVIFKYKNEKQTHKCYCLNYYEHFV